MKRHCATRLGGATVALVCLALPMLAVGAPPADAAQQPSAGQGSAVERSDSTRPPVYASPLDDYQPYRADEPMRDWREVNDEMGLLGGHVGHMAPPAGKGGGQP